MDTKLDALRRLVNTAVMFVVLGIIVALHWPVLRLMNWWQGQVVFHATDWRFQFMERTELVLDTAFLVVFCLVGMTGIVEAMICIYHFTKRPNVSESEGGKA